MLNKSSVKDIRIIIHYVKSKGLFYFIGLLGHSATEASVFILIPLITKYIIDASTNNDVIMLRKWVVLAGILCIVTFICFGVFGYMLFSSVNHIITSIRLRIFGWLCKLPMSYYDNNQSGDIVSTITNDLKQMDEMYAWVIRNGLFFLFTGLGSAIGMFILDWKISLTLFLIGFLSYIVNLKFISLLENISHALQKKLGEVTQNIVNTVFGLEVIKMFHIEQIIYDQFNKTNEEAFKYECDKAKKAALLDSSNYLLSWLNFGGFIIIGALLVTYGKIGFGTIIALTSLVENVSFALKQIGVTVVPLQNDLASVKRVDKIFSQEPEDEASNESILDSTKDFSIKLNDVHFQYTDKESILRELNLKLESGKIVAIVGPSGSGKSSIPKILLGYYPVASGNIMINNKEQNMSQLVKMREQIAYVSQNVQLFEGTIEDNIRYGNMKASEEEVIWAAKTAQAHDFIMNMPDGYKSLIVEQGGNLSGGEKQRIAIARAILKNAPILIFDEATAALDTNNESLIQESLQSLAKEKIILIVTHRLSAIKNADLIYVLDNGKVVEQGTHDKLIENNELYNKLYSLQFD